MLLHAKKRVENSLTFIIREALGGTGGGAHVFVEGWGGWGS